MTGTSYLSVRPLHQEGRMGAIPESLPDRSVFDKRSNLFLPPQSLLWQWFLIFTIGEQEMWLRAIRILFHLFL